MSRTIEELRKKQDLQRLGKFIQLKAEACLISESYELGDQYCDSSIRIAEKFNDFASLGSLYWLKTIVYQEMNLNERMVQSLYKAIEYYQRAGNHSREAEMLFELANVYEDTEHNELAAKTYLKCTELTDDSLLAGMAYLFSGRISLKKGDLKQAKEYINKGNGVMNSLKAEQTFYYYFIMGGWQKAMKRDKEALKNLEIAAALAVTPDLHSMVLCEMADIYIRKKNFSKAREMLETAKKTAYISNLLSRKVDVHRVLSIYYEKAGEPARALEEYKTWQGLKDSLHQNELSHALTRSVKESEYNKMEIKRAEQQRLKDEKEAQKLRRQKLIVYSIGSILVFVGVIALMLYRNNRQQKMANVIIEKEKQLSDGLLSNILPDEIATELKTTGITQAKDFHEVTVLFTDFKNFSVVSEQLTAQELVNEIDFYYSAFDKIITCYGVEKIKTIGDSYMCAGGLPVEKTTNPEDTVTAALEMRDFMLDEKQKRIKAGLPYLEIRIGLHSGPVVAGVVGTKKFAYDIWGDTVNIASRMESSGEPGKVNISSSTYELVKNKFTFQPRGKIQAKNKGMIEMYFVERSV